MNITTKKGDNGTSTLNGPDRIQKNDVRFCLLGDLDELNSYLGLIKAMHNDNLLKSFLEAIQSNIILISAHVYNPENKDYVINSVETEKLELEIDKMGKTYNWTKFTLTGANIISSHIDICRAIARRSERSLADVCEKFEICQETRNYINRLSDYLYLLARVNEPEGE